jgi:O-antigen/teichoic acid export membrane protein
MTHPPSPPEPPAGLPGKIVRGGAWLSAQFALRQGLRFLRVIIVARIVAPDDIGLIGMAALAITLVRVLTETGLQQALIHRQSESNETLDTAWTVLLIRNLVIAGAVAAGAEIVAGFFDEPRAAGVVRAVSLVLVMEAFTNIAAVMFQKRLDFRRQALYLGGSEIVEFAVTVVLALSLRNVWALVYGWIAGAAARAVFSYIAEPRRVRLCLSGPVLRELIRYGKWLTASSVLVYALLHGDNLIAGKFLGTAALGFYQIAFTVSNLPATAIAHVISTVMFPAYSALQHDRPRLGRLYLRSLRSTALLSIPVAALIGVLADVAVPVLLGEKWNPAVPVVQILAVYGLLRSLGATTGAVFLGIGRPEIRVRIQGAQLVIFAAAIYPMMKAWGLAGVAAAATTQMLLTNVYAVARAARECGARRGPVAEALLVPLVGGLAVVAVVGVLRSFTPLVGTDLVTLLVLASAGAIGYIGVVAAYDSQRSFRLRSELVDVFSAARREGGSE